MPPKSGIPLLLVLPEERVMTKDAFARITRYSAPLGIDAYRDVAHFTNDFEEAVFAMLPRLRQYKQRLYDAGAYWASMSGSGSTIVGAFTEAAARDRTAAQFGGVRVERAETV
jgi:4-diphosphocytidyl-2-C-methyl-D-erythritol kinase